LQSFSKGAGWNVKSESVARAAISQDDQEERSAAAAAEGRKKRRRKGIDE